MADDSSTPEETGAQRQSQSAFAQLERAREAARTAKLLHTAQAEIDQQRDRAEQATGLARLIEDVVCRGLELRRELVKCGDPRPYDDPTAFRFPAGSDGRALGARCHEWVGEVEACLTRWLPNRVNPNGDFMNALRAGVRSRRDKQCVQAPFVEYVDSLLLELRAIAPTVHILSFDMDQHIRDELTGGELDHAEQLLQIEGQHEEAILRAAGVIAGVALERHLLHIADMANKALPEGERRTFDKSGDGITACLAPQRNLAHAYFGMHDGI